MFLTLTIEGARIFQGWRDEEAQLFHGTFQQYLAVPTHVVAKVFVPLCFTA